MITSSPSRSWIGSRLPGLMSLHHPGAMGPCARPFTSLYLVFPIWVKRGYYSSLSHKIIVSVHMNYKQITGQYSISIK